MKSRPQLSFSVYLFSIRVLIVCFETVSTWWEGGHRMVAHVFEVSLGVAGDPCSLAARALTKRRTCGYSWRCAISFAIRSLKSHSLSWLHYLFLGFNLKDMYIFQPSFVIFLWHSSSLLPYLFLSRVCVCVRARARVWVIRKCKEVSKRKFKRIWNYKRICLIFVSLQIPASRFPVFLLVFEVFICEFPDLKNNSKQTWISLISLHTSFLTLDRG